MEPSNFKSPAEPQSTEIQTNEQVCTIHSLPPEILDVIFRTIKEEKGLSTEEKKPFSVPLVQRSWNMQVSDQRLGEVRSFLHGLKEVIKTHQSIDERQREKMAAGLDKLIQQTTKFPEGLISILFSMSNLREELGVLFSELSWMDIQSLYDAIDRLQKPKMMNEIWLFVFSYNALVHLDSISKEIKNAEGKARFNGVLELISVLARFGKIDQALKLMDGFSSDEKLIAFETIINCSLSPEIFIPKQIKRTGEALIALDKVMKQIDAIDKPVAIAELVEALKKNKYVLEVRLLLSLFPDVSTAEQLEWLDQNSDVYDPFRDEKVSYELLKKACPMAESNQLEEVAKLSESLDEGQRDDFLASIVGWLIHKNNQEIAKKLTSLISDKERQTNLLALIDYEF
jgi:hypothetical protein